ncbi:MULTISPECIES: NADH-quinone oxidoreductase subunit NuoK [Myroides]|jgi:NADH-quinone oxidoreductase subunit K|uniref:NADH-quinone oxidoreductase subunit K n=1 Tax=Myroides odoratus TaxID=256 RepID=A0A378RUJ0_MYROD|nr:MULTISPECIES: NADH-quinone oxidoreductase subunit NuoK [Myroides]MDH6602121.1 NADH-quinone oxidoreductase subunit K [Myroides gitamensis]EHQ42735.1 NADH dehydrogenase subunit K [Myroides odoratus DSM 2801]EKB07550.1 NADH-quinone oxidoreductase subunit K [Myroides odoratus CIP 103059]MBB1140348.1 NADH-quinone oxidoreductase subunit NuoK [Myroides sp. WP-1]MCS4237157.1 NADH-quinone oxidoreductase subunit K [Myroides odoratus]
MENVIEIIGIDKYIYLSILLFCIGVFGILYRRNAIVMFMCIEIMLNSANMLLVAFSTYHQDAQGQVFVFFTMAVAAAEVAVGLAILVSIYRNIGAIDIDKLKNLKG